MRTDEPLQYDNTLSAYGRARSTVYGAPLSRDELRKTDAQHLTDVKVRFVNVVDLFKLVPNTELPHGLTDREFEALFTTDTPVVLNFHAYRG